MGRRLGILAGRGELVAEVVDAARAAGDTVRVFALVPEAGLGGKDVEPTSIADPNAIFAALASFEATHVVMVGGIDLGAAARRTLAGAAGGEARIGDIDLALTVKTHLARLGIAVLGVHEIGPDLLAQHGPLAGPPARDEVRMAAQHALKMARGVGRLDLGQAAIASATRVLAAEDIGGTDALLERFAAYRANGIVAADEVLVLAKARKPLQPDYVDLPVIGAATVRRAHAAGLAAIAVEAGQTLVAGRAALEVAALELGLPVIGLSIDE